MLKEEKSICSIGVLYVVATPIGNLRDITYRAVEILRAVDYVAAEDKGYSKGLLSHLGIEKPMLSLRSENEEGQVEKILGLLTQGATVALISDAGTPVISDPGYRFIRALREKGVAVVPVPGPCALIAALSVSGFSADRFSFEGFLPAKSTARRASLTALQENRETLVFYETPHRINEVLQEMQECFGGERQAFIARELTKLFETLFRGSLEEAVRWVADPGQQRGEFVIVLEGKTKKERDAALSPEAIRVLTILLAELPTQQAAQLGAKITGVGKRLLYDQAVRLKSVEAKEGS